MNRLSEAVRMIHMRRTARLHDDISASIRNTGGELFYARPNNVSKSSYDPDNTDQSPKFVLE